MSELINAKELAERVTSEIEALAKRNTPNVRKIRVKTSRLIRKADPDYVLDLARALLEYDPDGLRSVAYELIQFHAGAYQQLDQVLLEELGQGINSWWTVDSFARSLSGPAWRDGLIDDETIHDWARSKDLWWRRAALVSTVALNVRTHGGQGDVTRTLAVCRELVDDHEDMVVKAMSWALRELVVHDPDAVREFLAEYEGKLAARARREVRNKLETGLKNPKGAIGDL